MKEEKLFAALGGIDENYLEEAARFGARKKRSLRPARVLIAAAVVAALTVTAGAVAYTRWDAAREDAGLPADAEVPEFVEYTPEEAESMASVQPTQAETTLPMVEGSKVELVSTLCSGTDVTAYVAISPVSQAMAEGTWDEAQGLYTFACWETGGDLDIEGVDSYDGYACGGTQIEYKAETETALVRLDFYGDVFAEATAITTGVMWHHEDSEFSEVKYYGTVTIPITPSKAVLFHPGAAFENDYLTGETANLTEVSVGASNISLTYEVRTFADQCQKYGGGADAWFVIGDAYWGYYDELDGCPRDTEYDELDAQVAYKRSWAASLTRLLETGYLTLTDGTEIPLSSLQETTISDSPDETAWSQEFVLPNAVSLSQVESLTLGDETYIPN